MQRVLLDRDIRPLSDFRAHTAEFFRKIRKTKRPLVITHCGRSAGVLLDVSEYENLLEQLEVLRDVREAEGQLDSRRGMDHERARRRVLQSLDV